VLRLVAFAVATVTGGESTEDEDRDCNITTGEETTGGGAVDGGGVGVAL